MRYRTLAAVGLAVALGFGRSGTAVPGARTPADLPSELSDQEFWSLSEALSEPNGYFRSDNLVSDELIFSTVVPALRQKVRPGGVYLGVGPEQNFTYIAAIKPKIAFVLDVRRGNRSAHLMYKALFELSSNRADFISRLFTKPRPAGLSATSSAADIMDAFWRASTGQPAEYDKNLLDIMDVLRRHGWPLSKDDIDGVAYAYHGFYYYGPSIGWSSTIQIDRGNSPSYRDLMTQTESSGGELSFLASESAFAAVKDLEKRNLVVPVVGNFAGPKALRAIGKYVRDHQATVSVFYVDEVEPYLRVDGTWSNFCKSAATLPLDASSVFIRPPANGAGQGYFSPKSGEQMIFSIVEDVKACTGPGG